MNTVSLSPVDLFWQAGPVVKFVMGLLILASIWCWVLIIEGVLGLRRLNWNLRAQRAGAIAPLIQPIAEAGASAARLTLINETAGERRSRIEDAMNRTGRQLLSHAQRGLPNLAVISSVAPFIGLFGTVWGIMTSFAGIAAAKDTSLAIVAPGIAEALAATAIGLAAAIPASVGYNRIVAALAGTGQTMGLFIEEEALRLACLPAKLASAPAKQDTP